MKSLENRHRAHILIRKKNSNPRAGFVHSIRAPGKYYLLRYSIIFLSLNDNIARLIDTASVFTADGKGIILSD